MNDEERVKAGVRRHNEGLEHDDRGDWDRAMRAQYEAYQLDGDTMYLEYLARAWMRSDDLTRPGLESSDVWSQITDLGDAIFRAMSEEAEHEVEAEAR